MPPFETSLREDVRLAPFTTLGIGGPARYFSEVASASALAEGVAWARSRGLPLFVLGGGSNIVVSDSGFPGLVLRMGIRGIDAREEGGRVTVKAGAGEEWDELVASSVERGRAGLECLSGIPGKVGATPVQNVGAYGQETRETLVSVEAYDLATGELAEMSASECELGYRSSRFKHRDRDRFIITAVTYRLIAGGKPAIRYAELKRYLDEHGDEQGGEEGAAEPTLAQARRAVLALRARKAMVIDPSDPDSRSVGSFFVNPVVTTGEFERIKGRALRLSGDAESMPSFPARPGHVKLSAAWLIEHAGFPRGVARGNVGTSTKHALAIINRGGGTAREIIALAEEIKAGVREVFDVTLAPEPVFVGPGCEY
ncbi:MAG TPA: UDP-N-acetylmuramate dehydrogenase [Blastocatellia bacterium]|nr:UDP-N-acetylmuramate dehydrogenase [Blastocatellia bacterium]